MQSPLFEAQALQTAHQQIQPYIHHTPVFESRLINELTGAKLFFKAENLQKVGAFKYRGACHALLCLSAAERQRGVLTHSSGNHAQALALAAREFGVPAWIVMPSNSPTVKLAAVRDYGAEVILCEPSLAARESTAAEVQTRTGAHFVHPYNDPRIIAGQSTAAQEFFVQAPALDHLLTPVGGGGLLAGSALAAHHFAPGLKVWGAEPVLADDAARSLAAGRIIPSENPQTIADGLLTSLGEWTFPVIQAYVTGIITVSEAEILAALRLILERLKLVVEPSAAVPLAAVLKQPETFAGQRLGIILSGGNLDLAKLGGWFDV